MYNFSKSAPITSNFCIELHKTAPHKLITLIFHFLSFSTPSLPYKLPLLEYTASNALFFSAHIKSTHSVAARAVWQLQGLTAHCPEPSPIPLHPVSPYFGRLFFAQPPTKPSHRLLRFAEVQRVAVWVYACSSAATLCVCVCGCRRLLRPDQLMSVLARGWLSGFDVFTWQLDPGG